MPKAKIEKPNGTIITIEGPVEEVEHLLNFYKNGGPEGEETKNPPPLEDEEMDEPSEQSVELSLSDIVNTIKTCQEAEAIEDNILDQSIEVNRVLLPLYIINKYMDNRFSLTTSEIAKITTDLGVRVFRQNVNRSLTGSGSGYVITDSVRKAGIPTKYRLNRRGEKYMKSVIHGDSDGE